MHSPPRTRPMPVTIPAAGASPPYIAHAASGAISRNGDPTSSRDSMRSLAVFFPCARWRSRARAPPPSRTRASRSARDCASPSWWARFWSNSAERTSTCDSRTLIDDWYSLPSATAPPGHRELREPRSSGTSPKEGDPVAVQGRPEHPPRDRRIALHDLPGGVLVVGFEHDDAEGLIRRERPSREDQPPVVEQPDHVVVVGPNGGALLVGRVDQHARSSR